MADSNNIILLASSIVVIGLIVYGFLQIFGREKATENDVQVIQRQIRGFACILLAQIVLAILMVGQDKILDMFYQ